MDYNKPYENQTILVTGGAGAIGSILSRALAEAGASRVIILDDLSSSYDWNIPNLPNVLFVKGSITNDFDLAEQSAKSFLSESLEAVPRIPLHVAAYEAQGAL